MNDIILGTAAIMGVQITYSSGSAEVIRLHHGTDINSAENIKNHGVVWEEARQHTGDGDFWTTANSGDAALFAHVNPMDGLPAVISFDVAVNVINECLEMQPVGVLLDFHNMSQEETEVNLDSAIAVVFTRAGFPILNESVSNIIIETV